MKSFAPTSKTIVNNANGTVQRIVQPMKTIVDNRPTAIAQRKLQQAAKWQATKITSVLQRKPGEAGQEDESTSEAPTVRQVLRDARTIFGPIASPQVAVVHKQLEDSKDPILDKPASIENCYAVGKKETEELAKQPHSEDPRDKFAKHPMVGAVRPVVASGYGSMLNVFHYMTKGMQNERERETGQR